MQDIDNMTPEEMRAALHAAEKPEGDVRTITVDGIPVTVDMRVLRGFESLMLMSEIYDEQNPVDKRTVALVRFCKLVLGDSMGDILDHLGGETATTEEVMRFVGQVMSEAQLKN